MIFNYFLYLCSARYELIKNGRRVSHDRTPPEYFNLLHLQIYEKNQISNNLLLIILIYYDYGNSNISKTVKRINTRGIYLRGLRGNI